ncbi:MAG: transposase, partial [candidate division WOR-3 bacterium]
DMSDVYSSWTETQAVKNKAQVWVFEALTDIRKRLPFELLGIDSDNGSEFINDQLLRYCQEEKIR